MKGNAKKNDGSEMITYMSVCVCAHTCMSNLLLYTHAHKFIYGNCTFYESLSHCIAGKLQGL